MIGCLLCGVQVHSLSLLLTHIRLLHASEPAPGFRVQCGLQQCPRTFTNFHTFRNHVYNRHGGADVMELEDIVSAVSGEDDHDLLEEESHTVMYLERVRILIVIIFYH